MNIYVIIQVIKYKEFDIIQVLLKPSSVFQRFNWYSSHSQRINVVYKSNLGKFYATMLKCMNKIPFIW